MADAKLEPISGEAALALALGSTGYVSYFWCLVASDHDEGEVESHLEMLEETDDVAPEDMTLAHFQLASWYATGRNVARDPVRAREHLAHALGKKIRLATDIDRAVAEVQKRLGLPAKLDLDRPLGPAMPNTPGNVHTSQLARTKRAELLRPAAPPKVTKKPIAHTDDVAALALSRDGERLLSGGNLGEVLLWDVRSRAATRRYKNASGCVTNAQFALDDNTVLLDCDSPWIRILDLERDTYEVMKGLESTVEGLAWLPDGKSWVSASMNGEICLWELATRKVVARRKQRGAWSLAISPDGSRVVVSDDKYVIHCYTLPALEPVVKLSCHRHMVEGLAFDRTGKRLLSSSRDHSIALWKLEPGQLVRQLTGHDDTVFAALFTSNDRAISGGSDGRLLEWNLDTGAYVELAKTKSIFAVTLIGNLVVYGGEAGVQFLDR